MLETRLLARHGGTDLKPRSGLIAWQLVARQRAIVRRIGPFCAWPVRGNWSVDLIITAAEVQSARALGGPDRCVASRAQRGIINGVAHNTLLPMSWLAVAGCRIAKRSSDGKQ
jgi:hypothetical protein